MEYFRGELHAIALKADPNYRVLRKIEHRAPYPWDTPENAKIGVLLHVDTTGPDPDVDEIISLGMLRFAYTDTGTILSPLDVFTSLRQPKKAIPKHVTRATGITPADVKGQRLSKGWLRDFIHTAELIICHDAGRVRRFCERYQSAFASKAWACSRAQIPWSHEGVTCTELPYIGFAQGFWFDNAVTDKLFALLQLLDMPLPATNRIAMVVLTEAAQRETSKVWALGAPYEVREQLRDRGYHWNGGQDGRYRAWYRDVDPTHVESELRFLDSLDVPDLAPLVTTVDATLRYSDRLF